MNKNGAKNLIFAPFLFCIYQSFTTVSVTASPLML